MRCDGDGASRCRRKSGEPVTHVQKISRWERLILSILPASFFWVHRIRSRKTTTAIPMAAEKEIG